MQPQNDNTETSLTQLGPVLISAALGKLAFYLHRLKHEGITFLCFACLVSCFVILQLFWVDVEIWILHRGLTSVCSLFRPLKSVSGFQSDAQADVLLQINWCSVWKTDREVALLSLRSDRGPDTEFSLKLVRCFSGGLEALGVVNASFSTVTTGLSLQQAQRSPPSAHY